MQGCGGGKVRASYRPAEQHCYGPVRDDATRVIVDDTGRGQGDCVHDKAAGQEGAGGGKHAGTEAQQEQEQLRQLGTRKVPYSPVQAQTPCAMTMKSWE